MRSWMVAPMPLKRARLPSWWRKKRSAGSMRSMAPISGGRRRLRLVGIGLAQRQQVGEEFQHRHRVARDMAAIGQDLAVELLREVAGGVAQRRCRRRQRQRGEGQRDAGAQPRPCRRACPAPSSADSGSARPAISGRRDRSGNSAPCSTTEECCSQAMTRLAVVPAPRRRRRCGRHAWRSSRRPARAHWRRRARCRRRACGAASESRAASSASRDWAPRSGTAIAAGFDQMARTAETGHSRSRARSAGRRGADRAARSAPVRACVRNSASDRRDRRAGAGAPCARTPCATSVQRRVVLLRRSRQNPS